MDTATLCRREPNLPPTLVLRGCSFSGVPRDRHSGARRIRRLAEELQQSLEIPHAEEGAGSGDRLPVGPVSICMQQAQVTVGWVHCSCSPQTHRVTEYHCLLCVAGAKVAGSTLYPLLYMCPCTMAASQAVFIWTQCFLEHFQGGPCHNGRNSTCH